MSKDNVRRNWAIKVPMVRLIDENGAQLGIYQIADAVRMAIDKGLDLLELAPNASPPVCKIMSHGKFKYQMKKKQHQAKLKQVVVHLKEVKIRPIIDKHDLDVKINYILRFLSNGDKAKVTMMFRGREMTHLDIGRGIMDKVWERLKDIAILESPPKLEGRNMIMVIAPTKIGKKQTLPVKKEEDLQKPIELKGEKSHEVEKQ